ncbi:protein of unknown function [Hyphomicrobium sp. MC1]|nr:protein of unknown function [Hyphomicrobium sp. MC1]
MFLGRVPALDLALYLRVVGGAPHMDMGLSSGHSASFPKT